MSQQAPIYRGSRSDEWRTPPELILDLSRIYGAPTWDLAATENNSVAPTSFTAQNSFLEFGQLEVDPLWGWAWCNPPFSLALEFFEHIGRLAYRGARVIAIYKSGNMETAAWRAIHASCDWICQPPKRVEYLTPDGKRHLTDGKATGAQFASCLIGWNMKPPQGMGNVWRPGR